jgi:putative transcriptional regulator
LGAKIENEQKLNAVAEQLSRINEQLAIKNRRARRIWKTVAIVFIAFVAVNILLIIFGLIGRNAFNNITKSSVVDVTDYDVDEDIKKERLQ